MPDVQRVFHTLEPLFDRESRVLILGSFPSVVSRQKSFYYANPTNRFWPVLEALFHETITDRKEFCLRKHIALWDVIESCTIHGSSDSSIRDVKANDIEWLIQNSSVHAVFTTGAKAASLYKKYVSASLDACALPSTSAANAHMRLDDLVKEYDCVRKALEP